jgi:hypothetical protein
MVVIYGMIFNVDLKRGKKFMQREQIKAELQDSNREFESLKLKFEKVQVREKQIRTRIIQERGIQD